MIAKAIAGGLDLVEDAASGFRVLPRDVNHSATGSLCAKVPSAIALMRFTTGTTRDGATMRTGDIRVLQ